ncbi:hypothetical protein [Hymenobacter glacieicola]|uniref:hypothetical protein n=1 Tax=Hymenobacter glacieicola TaxID=1562124 RepID=UPI00166E00EA|nr:hypothetical protein [Hymenobacter glacieicola]
MLYQLNSPLAILIIAADFFIVSLLAKLLLRPRVASVKWPIILTIIIVAIPLTGINFLLSSPGTAASTPGSVIIKNPEHHVDKLYFLWQYPKGTWQVEWVEYLLTSGKEVVLESESQNGLEVAYQHNGNWYYAPIHFDTLLQADITFPQDFTAVDTSGRIAAAVAGYTLTELGSWLSNLLTVASIGLWATLVGRLFSSKSRLAAAP